MINWHGAVAKGENPNETAPYVHGYGEMVIMSMKAYEEKLLMLDFYSKLAEAEDDIQAGRLLDADTALKQLREKYHI